MEYVPGTPITDYCDEHKLNTKEAESVPMQVCEAIQHAHQKGIIHRDIKPIERPRHDAGRTIAVPKIIDFGIAKATSPQLNSGTAFTEQGQMVGTPAYMSPEQADFGRLDIDTRSDIYSLGALLYEMLVGTPPFDAETLRNASFGAIQRLLREQQPARPSTRVLDQEDSPRFASTANPSIRRHLHRELRGDLDWIILKALEKDRSRRYATALEFAADIKRHLATEPVLAGPPSATYRLGKFARRNALALSASLLILLTLIGGAGAVVWQRGRAQSQADVAGAVIQILGDLFSSASQGSRQGIDTETLDAVAQQMERDDVFGDQPRIRGRITGWIAYAYSTLGRDIDAIHHWQQALRLRTVAHGAHDSVTITTRNSLARVMLRHGNIEEAEAMSRAALAAAQDGPEPLGPTHSVTLQASGLLAQALTATHRYEEAEKRLRATLITQSDTRGPEHRDTLRTMVNLAKLLADTSHFEEALELMDEVVKVTANTTGPGNARTKAVKNDRQRILEQSKGGVPAEASARRNSR